MAAITFDIDEDVARKIAGFFNSGRAGRLVFYVGGRRVTQVECRETWDNGACEVRRYAPTASGVFVVKHLTVPAESM